MRAWWRVLREALLLAVVNLVVNAVVSWWQRHGERPWVARVLAALDATGWHAAADVARAMGEPEGEVLRVAGTLEACVRHGLLEARDEAGVVERRVYRRKVPGQGAA